METHGDTLKIYGLLQLSLNCSVLTFNGSVGALTPSLLCHAEPHRLAAWPVQYCFPYTVSVWFALLFCLLALCSGR